MVFLAFLLTLGGCGFLTWLVYTMRAIREDAHAARQDSRSALQGMKDLAETFRKAHPYPGPSAAAVVTEAPSPSKTPAEADEPAPAAMRGALLPVAGEVAEDARRTVEIPKLPSAGEEDDGDRETPEEGTRIYSRRAVPLAPKRPTLLGGLAGAPPDASPGVKHDRPSSPTLVSPGAAPPSESRDDGSMVVEVRREDGTPLLDRKGPSKGPGDR